VPIFTTLSRAVVDTFHGYEAQYVTNIGIKVINALISLVTVMMIFIFAVITLLYTWTYNESPFEPFSTSLNFFGAHGYTQAVEAFTYPLRSEPVYLEVDNHPVAEWESNQKRASVIEEFESGSVVLKIDSSDMHAHLALVNLVISITITFLMVSFAIYSNIMLYQSIVRTLERIYMALNRTLMLQRQRQQLAYADQIREFYSEDQVDGDLAKFESVIQNVLRLVSSDVNAVFNQHPGMNYEAKQLISYLTGSSSSALKSTSMKQRNLKVSGDYPRKSVDPGLGLNIREKLYLWDFNVLSYPAESLASIIVTMFHELHLLHPHGLSKENRQHRSSMGESFLTRAVLEDFVAAIQKRYSAENPYHNFHHCTDVAHATFLIITSIREKAQMSSLECFSLLIAALAHDLEHPGVNNAFLIKSKHQLALRYNDIAVLENKHASCLFEITSGHPDVNIFQDMDESSWEEARKLIIHAIIHTDMAKHFSMVSRMEVRDESSFLADFEEDRLFLGAIILHAADISNPARTPDIATAWATRVLEEFFSQGDLEKLQGHTISPMCDRSNTSLHQTQKNFIQFVVIPLYKAMADTFPELQCMHRQALQTMEYWASYDQP